MCPVPANTQHGMGLKPVVGKGLLVRVLARRPLPAATQVATCPMYMRWMAEPCRDSGMDHGRAAQHEDGPCEMHTAGIT